MTNLIECESCGSMKNSVINSRRLMIGELTTQHRVRKCHICGTTTETAEVLLSVAQEVYSGDEEKLSSE